MGRDVWVCLSKPLASAPPVMNLIYLLTFHVEYPFPFTILGVFDYTVGVRCNKPSFCGCAVAFCALPKPAKYS